MKSLKKNRGISSQQVKEALAAYESLREDDIRPSIPVLLSALKACSISKNLQAGTRIHRDLSQSTNSYNISVANSLVDMYANCRSLVDARRVFDSMPQHSVVSWNSIILGSAQCGKGDLALQLFGTMQEQGCEPDSQLYVAALKACTSLAVKPERKDFCLQQGMSLHSELASRGYESNIFVANTLVDLYAKCGRMVFAQGVFDRMLQRDFVSWNAIILGYVQSGEAELALKLFSRMQEEGCRQDSVLFLAALKACCSLAENERGELVKGKLLKVSSLEKCRALHDQLAESGHQKDMFVANTLLDLYAKCGSMEDARRVFDRMQNRSVVSWTGIITGYANSDQGEVALRLFKRMQEEGCCVPDARLFMAALKACASLVSLEDGKKIHAQICSAELEKDLLLANSLISFYGKCGSMAEAKQVFDSADSRDTVSWTALIAGYSQQGDTDRVFALFDRMQKERIRPNGVTLLCVLTACSHAGLVEKGKQCFEAMSSVYSIAPSIQHYLCIVDLLARGSKLEEAVAILKSMPYKPNLLAWRTVLAAAVKWRSLEVGKLAFDSILRIGDEEDDDAAYTLMGKIYASEGMWEDFAKTEAMRKSEAQRTSSRRVTRS